MLSFVTGSERRFGPAYPTSVWTNVLLVAAGAGVAAASRPWIQVRFERLFGEVFGPPAWQTSAGFTCLCTCALLFVMALAETQTRAARQAVRPASLLLAAVMAVVVAGHALAGPGMLRGVSAAWTVSAYLGGVATLGVLAACAARYRQHRRPRRQHDASGNGS